MAKVNASSAVNGSVTLTALSSAFSIMEVHISSIDVTQQSTLVTHCLRPALFTLSHSGLFVSEFSVLISLDTVLFAAPGKVTRLSTWFTRNNNNSRLPTRLLRSSANGTIMLFLLVFLIPVSKAASFNNVSCFASCPTESNKSLLCNVCNAVWVFLIGVVFRVALVLVLLFAGLEEVGLLLAVRTIV